MVEGGAHIRFWLLKFAVKRIDFFLVFTDILQLMEFLSIKKVSFQLTNSA